MYRDFVCKVNDQRSQRMADSLSKHIRTGDSVLDCGCGGMEVADSLHKKIGVEAMGIDIIHLNQTDLRSCVGDATRLPFADASFDVIYAAFVLHHTHRQEEIVGECLRVARQRVIFLEDVYRNWVELRWLQVSDWIGNKSVSEEIPLPFTFRTEAEWIDLFQKWGGTVSHVESIRPLVWLLSRHRMFVVERNGIG
jgi:ubiquinone/menaquinone biosynthesis C-methylase UbiE